MTDYPASKPSKFIGYFIVAMIAPVYFAFLYLGRPGEGRVACVFLGMSLLAIRIRWELRKEIWLWAVIAALLALHLPLILFVPWPTGWVPAVGLMPLAVLDCVATLWIIGLVEKWRNPAANRTPL